MAANITTGSTVKVFFGSAIAGGFDHYVATVTGFQPGTIGLYEVVWAETVPGYMARGTVDLIESDRVSGF